MIQQDIFWTLGGGFALAGPVLGTYAASCLGSIGIGFGKCSTVVAGALYCLYNMRIYTRVYICYVYIWSRPPSLHPPPPPPHGLGPQVAAPIPFYLQAIGNEVQLRIC